MNKQEFTKVICQNCGAEVLIPTHGGQVATGTVIGKDSGLGTIVLPTADNGDNTPEAAIDKLWEMAKGNPEMAKLVAEVAGNIAQDDYLEVKGVVRRWLPSQVIRLLSNTWSHDFHNAVKQMGYAYSWKVLVDDLKWQAKAYEKNDIDAFNDRNRFYNKDLAVKMAQHDYDEIKEYEKSLPFRRCKHRVYKKISIDAINCRQGLFNDDIDWMYTSLNTLILRIKFANTPSEIYRAVKGFVNFRTRIRVATSVCNAFLNVYKAAGGYYTIKDLILYENCFMNVDNNGNSISPSLPKWMRSFTQQHQHLAKKEESLIALERHIQSVIEEFGGITENGYKVLGLLRDFVEYNNFDCKQAGKRWHQESEKRREMRKAQKNRRNRK